MRRATGWALGVVLALAGWAAAGCNNAPPEPEPAAKARPAPTSAGDITWEAPPTWTEDKRAKKGKYRARYQIPAAGDDKGHGDLLVWFAGRGAKGDVKKPLDEFEALFEKVDPATGKERKTRKMGKFEVEWLDIKGTYRYPMGPSMGRKKMAAAHVIKADWHGIAAGVKTPKRGNWVFKMVGPADTIASAKSSFEAMIERLK